MNADVAGGQHGLVPGRPMDLPQAVGNPPLPIPDLALALLPSFCSNLAHSKCLLAY
jgi:hypothetical protein